MLFTASQDTANALKSLFELIQNHRHFLTEKRIKVFTLNRFWWYPPEDFDLS
jgi:hypothetical protein